MLTRLIVALYVWFLEIALWLTLLIASIAGYNLTVSMLNDAGAIVTNEFVWKLVGALMFPVIAFLVLTVVIGPFLILLDLRQALRNIEARVAPRAEVTAPLHFERRDPTL